MRLALESMTARPGLSLVRRVLPTGPMRLQAKEPQVDPLNDALEFLRMSDTTYYHGELAAPWGLVMPEKTPKFHYVVSGPCWVGVGQEPMRQVAPGDFVIVPRGVRHRLASAPSAANINLTTLPCEQVSGRYARVTKRGNGVLTTIVCGDLNFTHPGAQHLIALLPPVMHLRAPHNDSIEWLRNTLRFMAAEAEDIRPGGEAIMRRLADILVIQAIRHWIEANPEQGRGWVAALQDVHLRRALAKIHEEPEKNWTIGQLASAAGLSRSVFAARFTRQVGEPVMQYLTRWRMHRAMAYLKRDGKTVDEVATLLGYSSGAAFSRAFKRFEGTAPGGVRRRAVTDR